MGGRRGARCGARTRKGRPCVAKAFRTADAGTMVVYLLAHAPRLAKSASGCNEGLVGLWQPKDRRRYMRAVAQRQLDQMQRIRKRRCQE
jgi:hypothetical protein